MSNKLKQLAPNIGLLIFGFVAAILIIEIGSRLIFFSLPYPVQISMSGARQWGIAGPPMGSLLNSLNFFDTCEGDEHLFARLLPNLSQVPIRVGPQNIYHVTSEDLGFESIGFRSRAYDGLVDGIVLGDSFGFCMGVELEDCWVYQLEDKTDLRLANLSVVGSGSVSHLRYLEDFGLALNPEFIIWQYFVNDPINDYSHIIEGKQGCPRTKPAAVSRPEKPLQGLRDWLSHTLVTYNLVMAPALRTLLPQLAGPEGALPEFEQVATTNGKRFLAYTNLPSSKDQRTIEGMELTQDAILTASQIASDNGSLFLLVLAPDSLQVYRDFLPASEQKLAEQANSSDTTTEQMILFAENHGINYLDLRSEFRDSASQKEALTLYLEYDSHWSPSGNTLAAKIIADWFKERSFKQ